ncbi:MAG: glycosyltransferase family 39 protein [Bacteroidia bacterium]|jgi:4-amino-4-deoxy-L-arabinose transferase|nr:glycosyltransferase family 39 protein [Bacteroidia bacterium]
MANPVFTGSLVCSAVAAGYIASVFLFIRSKTLLAVALLVLCGAALSVYVSSDKYLHEWDERFHALVARNMMDDPLTPKLYSTHVLPYDHTDWTSNQVWLHKQPLPLWLMAGSMYITGINEWGVRLPSIIATSLLVLLTFFIGRRLMNERIGFIAALLCSFNGLIIETSGGRAATDHYDVLYLFFITLGVWMALRFVDTKKTVFNLLTAVAVSAAILTRWLPALIVLPLWLVAVVDSAKFSRREIIFQFLLLCTAVAVLVLPWQIYSAIHFPDEWKWEQSYNLRHFTEALEGHSGPWYFHFEKMSIAFGDYFLAVLGWFTWRTFRQRNTPGLLLLIWLWVPLLFFTLAATKMTGYTLFTAPAAFIMIGAFCNLLWELRENKFWKIASPLLFAAFLFFNLRYSNERIKFFDGNNRNPRWVQQLRQINSTHPSPKTIFFNVNRPVETMFYTGCLAYPVIPDADKLKELQGMGYRVVINADKKTEIPFDGISVIHADALLGVVQED